MRKHKSDRLILFLTLGLMLIGLVVIYAIGPQRANFLNTAYGQHNSPNGFFIKQLISVTLSIVVFSLAFKLPYEKIRTYAKAILLLGLILSALLYVFGMMHIGLAKCDLGACRWLNLGPLSFQPSELLKMGLVLYLAQLMSRRQKEERGERDDVKKQNDRKFWLRFGGYALISIFFVVVAQKDLGSGIPMMVIGLAILWVGGVETKKFLRVVLLLTVLGVVAIFGSEHRRERLLTFGNASGANKYHIQNALIAIGTGGFGGVGVSNSVQATGYLPESINDSVFAIMGETFGFMGLMFVLTGFMFLLLRILKVSEATSDNERSLVTIGVFAWIMTHVVVNIMAMTGLAPVTGITLPLLSYGGTSMVFVAAGLGMVLQFSCYADRINQNVYKDLTSLRRRRTG